MADQDDEEVDDQGSEVDPEVDRDDDLAEEDHMLREDEQIDSHDQDLVVEKLLTVHLHQRDHRHLEQIDQPTLREHDDREDDLVDPAVLTGQVDEVIGDEDHSDLTDEEREEEDRLEETEEVIGEDRDLDDLVMERVEADRGSGQIEEVTGRHLHSTKPEKLVLREP